MIVVEESTPRAFREIVDQLSDYERRGSRIGGMREQIGALVVSDDPRERYLFRDDSFNLAFQLQEHWAYWKGANPGGVQRYNSNMETWIDEETGKLPGSAYGDRMRNTAGHDQIARAVEQIRSSPETRRAMIIVHQARVEDYSGDDVACTAYLHPFARDGELHMVAALRSQDMYWGYPYDTANNQWIQETMAGLLGLDVGKYWHFMDSCHYYTDFEDDVFAAADSCVISGSTDCRLAVDDFDAAWDELTRGLGEAKGGSVPRGRIDELAGVSRFHADWLSLMTAYEQHRFFGGVDDELVDLISDPAWRMWMAARAD